MKEITKGTKLIRKMENGKILEMEVMRVYKDCYSCKVTNQEHYRGNFRVYKNWIEKNLIQVI